MEKNSYSTAAKKTHNKNSMKQMQKHQGICITSNISLYYASLQPIDGYKPCNTFVYPLKKNLNLELNQLLVIPANTT